MTQNHPLLSVILPVYNSENFIKETISSILEQSFKDFELIIIDDCSSDQSPEIIKSFNDQRINYFQNETNLKLIKTLNRGVELAKGKYIARMDSDDICLPNRFECQVEYLENHPEIGMAGCLPIIIDENGHIIHKSRHFIATSHMACKFACFFENQFVHSSVIFRSEVIKDFKYSEVPYSLHMEDRELWCRMFLADIKMANMSKYLLKYRIHSGSICDSNKVEQTINALTIAINYFKHYFHGDIDAKLYEDARNCVSPMDKAIKTRMLIFKMYDVFTQREGCNFYQKLQIMEWIAKFLLEEMRPCASTQKVQFLLTSNWKIWLGIVQTIFFMLRALI